MSASPIGTPVRDELEADPRVSWVEDVLRFGDTDANGHINNAVYSVLCESGRVNLFHTRLTGVFEDRRYFVIARFAIEYRRELLYPGRVSTATWITRLGNSSIGLAQGVFGEAGLAAEAEATCVLMDGATRRATPFPPALRALIESSLRPAVP